MRINQILINVEESQECSNQAEMKIELFYREKLVRNINQAEYDSICQFNPKITCVNGCVNFEN